MYELICGEVHKIKDSGVVIIASGVGYFILTSLQDLAILDNKVGSSVTIYTHLNHKEDNMTLFGFIDEASRDGFRKLIKVDGVGPRTALAILSKHSYTDILKAINNEDVLLLKKIPGIGDKTAKKMILDLKGTLILSNDSLGSNQVENDLILAMIQMGYNRNEVIKIYEKGRPYTGVFSDDIKKMIKLLG